jgi:hypothetical protein
MVNRRVDLRMPISLRCALAMRIPPFKARQKLLPMDRKDYAAAIRASVTEVVRTAHDAVADSQAARVQARGRVQETKALVQRVHARRVAFVQSRQLSENTPPPPAPPLLGLEA